MLITQSNYIPWKGFFDTLNVVDDFVIYDSVQYTRRDWRNRNRVKTASGMKWLTIPVQVKDRRDQSIDETLVADEHWAARHWQMIRHSYARAPCWDEFSSTLGPAWSEPQPRRLTEINERFLRLFCGLLGIAPTFHRDADFELVDGRTDRLVSICRQLGATEYVSGPSAKAYLDESAFSEAGVAIRYLDYSGYPEYPQLHGAFEHAVSVLDLVLHTGRDARSHLKSVRFGEEALFERSAAPP